MYTKSSTSFWWLNLGNKKANTIVLNRISDTKEKKKQW